MHESMIPEPHKAAFVIPDTELSYGQSGLTKREYAAIKAMQGLLAGCADGEVSYRDVAKKARAYADALLEELTKSEQGEE